MATAGLRDSECSAVVVLQCVVCSSVLLLLLLTFIIGHVPQRRVTGVALALTLIEAPFNPALWKDTTELITQQGETQITTQDSVKMSKQCTKQTLNLQFHLPHTKFPCFHFTRQIQLGYFLPNYLESACFVRLPQSCIYINSANQRLHRPH